MAQKRETGTVKRITDKGYGFIECPGKDDVFFRTQGLDFLHEGNCVSFIINVQPDGRTRAAEIKLSEDHQGHQGPMIKVMGRSTTTNFTFSSDYLKDGYFENGEKYLRAEQLDNWAIEIAKLFHNCNVNSHQLRRLF